MASSFRLRERFEGAQWLGKKTPDDDAYWFVHLPSGDNNVRMVEFIGDRLKLTTYLTESVVDIGDYVLIGGNGQPLVMPENVFESRYEVVEDGRGRRCEQD